MLLPLLLKIVECYASSISHDKTRRLRISEQQRPSCTDASEVVGRKRCQCGGGRGGGGGATDGLPHSTAHNSTEGAMPLGALPNPGAQVPFPQEALLAVPVDTDGYPLSTKHICTEHPQQLTCLPATCLSCVPGSVGKARCLG